MYPIVTDAGFRKQQRTGVGVRENVTKSVQRVAQRERIKIGIRVTNIVCLLDTVLSDSAGVRIIGNDHHRNTKPNQDCGNGKRSECGDFRVRVVWRRSAQTAQTVDNKHEAVAKPTTKTETDVQSVILQETSGIRNPTGACHPHVPNGSENDTDGKIDQERGDETPIACDTNLITKSKM